MNSAILDLEVRMAQKHKNNHFIKFVMPYLVQSDKLLSIFGQLVQDIKFIFFLGGHLGF